MRSRARPGRRFRCSSKGRAAAARSSSPAASTGSAPGAIAGCARSTARHCPTICSKRSSSGTRAARSPAPSASAPASSRKPTAARCFSTKWGSSRRGRRRSCCGCCRTVKCGVWARTCRDASMRGSSPQPIGASTRKSPADDSGPIFASASTSCESPCRRCATARPTFRQLAAHFWTDADVTASGSSATLTAETLSALARYDWPGNVRELQNAIASLAVHAPRRGRSRAVDAAGAHRAMRPRPAAATFEAARHEFERRFVRAALAQAGGQRIRAARALGVSRQGLAKMLRRLRIDAEQ